MLKQYSPFLNLGTGIVITFREPLQWGWAYRSLKVGDLRIPTYLLLAVDFVSNVVKLPLPIMQFWSEPAVVKSKSTYNILYQVKWFPALFVGSIQLDGYIVDTITGYRDSRLEFLYRSTGALLVEVYQI